jgi:hypothetical protein
MEVLDHGNCSSEPEQDETRCKRAACPFSFHTLADAIFPGVIICFIDVIFPRGKRARN